MLNPVIIERFWAKVDKTSTCWLWTAFVDPHRGGYGQFWPSHDSRALLAHRVAYEISSGAPIPDGKWVLHHCDVRRCVRPDHLYLGTNADNVRDRHSRNRDSRGERHRIATLGGRTPKNKTALVSVASVLAAREMFSRGVSQAAIGRALSLDFRRVHEIVHGQSWKSVK